MASRLLFLFILTIATAFGGLVTIVNSGFEDPALSDGGYTTDGAVTGWVGSGVSGVFNPQVAAYPTVPEGVQVALLNAGGSLTQDLGVSSVIGNLYTLSGWIGNWALDATGTIELLFGATPVITLSVNPPANSFVELSGSFVATTSENMSIRLTTSGSQSNFDAISLSEVPEPGTYALVGLGLAALGLWRRRKIA